MSKASSTQGIPQNPLGGNEPHAQACSRMTKSDQSKTLNDANGGKRRGRKPGSGKKKGAKRGATSKVGHVNKGMAFQNAWQASYPFSQGLGGGNSSLLVNGAHKSDALRSTGKIAESSQSAMPFKPAKKPVGRPPKNKSKKKAEAQAKGSNGKSTTKQLIVPQQGTKPGLVESLSHSLGTIHEEPPPTGSTQTRPPASILDGPSGSINPAVVDPLAFWPELHTNPTPVGVNHTDKLDFNLLSSSFEIRKQQVIPGLIPNNNIGNNNDFTTAPVHQSNPSAAIDFMLSSAKMLQPESFLTQDNSNIFDDLNFLSMSLDDEDTDKSLFTFGLDGTRGGDVFVEGNSGTNNAYVIPSATLMMPFDPTFPMPATQSVAKDHTQSHFKMGDMSPILDHEHLFP